MLEHIVNWLLDLFSIPGTPAGQQSLYTILPEKKIDRFGKDIMGSTHVYDLSKKSQVAASSDTVEISLNPEELDMDKKGLEEKYEEQLRKKTAARAVEPDEDLSDMVAEHAAKQSVSS